MSERWFESGSGEEKVILDYTNPHEPANQFIVCALMFCGALGENVEQTLPFLFFVLGFTVYFISFINTLLSTRQISVLETRL